MLSEHRNEATTDEFCKQAINGNGFPQKEIMENKWSQLNYSPYNSPSIRAFTAAKILLEASNLVRILSCES
jgi:hypothetical protein